jgi:hypothetical protein
MSRNQMPTPPNKTSKPTSGETKRDNLVLMVEEACTGCGFLVGLLVFGALVRILGDTYLRGFGPLWIGWTGCLLLIATALPCAVFAGAGLVIGWWVWLRLFAKRMAVTKQEAYLLATGPFPVPVLSRLCLRIAGISKAEEKQLYKARRDRR